MAVRTSIPDKKLTKALDRVQKAQSRFWRHYPGDSGARQAVHTVYGGAHLFTAETPKKLGELALKSLDTYAPDAATFETGYADMAIASWKLFERLQREGVIPTAVKFQISLPTPIAPTYNNMVPTDRPALIPMLTKHLLSEVAAIARALPHDRIALQLSGNPLGLSHDDMVIEQSKSTSTALLSANINGSTLCAVDVGGSFGRDLSGQGEKAMTAFAVEWLSRLYGSDVAAAVKKSSATRWNASPYVLGAMSAAPPGAQGLRKVLGEPVGNLFLAGEATHETLWGTVDGAWESGERAAVAALQKIGALPEPAATAPRAPKQRRRGA